MSANATTAILGPDGRDHARSQGVIRRGGLAAIARSFLSVRPRNCWLAAVQSRAKYAAVLESMEIGNFHVAWASHGAK